MRGPHGWCSVCEDPTGGVLCARTPRVVFCVRGPHGWCSVCEDPTGGVLCARTPRVVFCVSARTSSILLSH